MSKIRILAILLALCALFICGCGERPPVDVPDGYKIASGEAAEYYFFVPSHWTVDINSTATSATVSNVDPASVSVMTWASTNSDATLADWWNTFVPDFEKVYTDFAVEAEEEMLIDKEAAHSVTYVGSIGETQYRFRQISTIHNGIIYVLTYTNVAASFDDHTEDFTNIAGYFLFK